MPQAANVVREYRRFLKLLRRYSETNRIVPSLDVDEVSSAVSSSHNAAICVLAQVWHAHILYTEQYVADCERVFGHYLHHSPSDDTAEARVQDKQGYADVLKMYRQGSLLVLTQYS